MEKKMRKIYLFLMCVLFTSCSFGGMGSKNQLSIATWNVQTFFDGVNDGCEYQEFRKSDNWNNEKYLERLKRLCQVIIELDADVIVLEEIENQGILYDISNQLAGNSWNQKKNWNYGCFAKNDGDSIGCGVLSRFELGEMKIHNLMINTECNKQPSMRPLVEVHVVYGNKLVTLFANHWKSKSGGAEETEVWRNWQESVLGNRIKSVVTKDEENSVVIACGDFNRNVFEFHKNDNGMINFTIFGDTEGQNVKSCWLDENGELNYSMGSYYFQDAWEWIDHFFVSENVDILEFNVCAKEPWCTEDGIPSGYKIYSGQGYSDHIPLKCIVKF